MRALIVIAACLLLCGCYGNIGYDNTASGGGLSGFTWGRCEPPAKPIGGGDGELDPSARDGGTITRPRR